MPKEQNTDRGEKVAQEGALRCTPRVGCTDKDVPAKAKKEQTER